MSTHWSFCLNDKLRAFPMVSIKLIRAKGKCWHLGEKSIFRKSATCDAKFVYLVNFVTNFTTTNS